MNQLQFFSHKEIDIRKWDASVTQAAYSLPYAYSWYLDAVAENWDGLVWGEYEAVMPLVWVRKLGVKCLYQPYYCQQGGLFSKQKITDDLQAQFLAFVRKNFLYANINLNHSNLTTPASSKLKPKRNLVLPLAADYLIISKKFSENHRRNISKAIKKGLVFSTNTEEQEFVNFYLGNINREKENFKTQHEKILKRLVKKLLENGMAEVCVVSNTKNEWLAASVVINHQNRLINIINTSSAEGKTSGASHFLFSEIVKKYASKNLLLDFEGSSIASIARFYEGFGAQEENFLQFKHVVGERFSQLFL